MWVSDAKDREREMHEPHERSREKVRLTVALKPIYSLTDMLRIVVVLGLTERCRPELG